METKVKKREWVKDAAIIFLAVLLVLTFFSNTIMNRSLPEVATAAVTEGSIVSKVRGSGTVTANGKQQVKAKETRTIRAVMIKTGQEVNAGDVLFVLGEGDETALEQAKETLRNLQYSYQRSAVSLPTFDSSGYDRSIKRAEAELREATAKEAEAERQFKVALSIYGTSEKEFEAAERELEAYKVRMEVAEADLAEAKENLDKLSDEYTAALAEVEMYQEILDGIDKRIAELAGGSGTEGGGGSPVTDDSPFVFEDEPTVIIDDSGYDAADIVSSYSTNDAAIVFLSNSTLSANDAASELAQLQLERIQAEANLERAQARLKLIEQQEQNAQGKQDAYQRTKANYEKCLAEYYRALAEYEKKIPVNALQYKEALDNARSAREYAEEEVDAAYATLESARESFNRTVASSYIDLQQTAEEISIQQEKIKSLAGDEENVVTATVSGTIDTIDCTAGDTVVKDGLMCTIEVPDMGHTLSFSVTNDQAQRLRIGDTATVSNYYWGSSVTATLTSIRTDPKNPQNGKILTFDLTGDVTTGSELTISVGQKSANYDTVVPNSAIKSDTNGSFVLAVSVKSSPLGNRYTARRVSVEVLASDDNNSAVIADLANGDFVITTSSAPIRSGDMVRMADN